MVYLILAVISSALVSIAMRLSKTKVRGDLGVLCINYVVCLLMSWAVTGFAAPLPEAAGLTLALGGVNGVLYLAGFVLLQCSIRDNGVVLSSTFMKLGLLVSILLSILCFGEMPTWLHWLGFVLAVAAILLINGPAGGKQRGNLWLLLALMWVNGFADGMSKVYEELGSPALSGHFLLYTFAAALVCCTALAVRGKEPLPGKAELGYGLLIGVPNFLSARFLLRALGDLPGVLVYPAASVGTILVVTVAGVVLFREKLLGRQRLALGMILLALVMLNL